LGIGANPATAQPGRQIKDGKIVANSGADQGRRDWCRSGNNPANGLQQASP